MGPEEREIMVNYPSSMIRGHWHWSLWITINHKSFGSTGFHLEDSFLMEHIW